MIRYIHNTGNLFAVLSCPWRSHSLKLQRFAETRFERFPVTRGLNGDDAYVYVLFSCDLVAQTKDFV
jgi:hypothetical protein